MKSKFSFVIVYWWLFILLVCGILLVTFAEKEERLSESENRMLSGFPEVTAESIFSGNFSTGFENYLSDGVFGRDTIVGASESMLRVFSINTDEETALLNEIEMSDELQGITPDNAVSSSDTAADPTVSDSDTENTDDPSASAGEESSADEDETAAESIDDAPVSDKMDGNGLFFKLPNGKYKRTHYVSVNKLKTVASMLNNYKSCLPEDGNVFYTNIPLTDTGIMLRNKTKYKGWYENYDIGIKPYLDDGVYFINTPALLESDLIARKDMYFRSDHHWTPLAAIKVVNECMRVQGVPTVPYNEYDYKVGTFKNSKRGTADRLDLLYPLQEVKGNKLPKGKTGKTTPLIQYKYKTYIAYLSGDSNIWTRYVTGFSTDRKSLVIGDSFSNAFTPYLMPYYDEVYKVDARYYKPEENGGSIKDLMNTYEIDDVYIIVSYANGVRSKTSLEKLEKALYGK